MSRIKRHLGDLSTVELDEKYLPSKAFLNTSEFERSRNLSTLPEYIQQFTPEGDDELRGTVEATASPHTLFIASSGIRAADLAR
jgi:protein CMS1